MKFISIGYKTLVKLEWVEKKCSSENDDAAHLD